MSDTTKPMVVWASQEGAVSIGRRKLFPSDVPHLLLPIEDGALRVGDHLFQRIGMTDMFRTDADPEGEWYDVDALDMWDLLMDAVEGVEP